MTIAISLLSTLVTSAQPQPTAAEAALAAPTPLSAYIAEDPAPPPTGWTGSLSIGATLQDGNTDSRAINANADAERRGEDDRWTLKGFWDYGETKDQTTGDYVLNSRKAGARVKYDYFLSKTFYANAFAGVDTDSLADLTLRTYGGVGVGYQWHEDEAFKWGSEAGPTYFSEDRKVAEDTDYIAARVANNIEWKINDKVALLNTIEAFPSLEDGDDFYGRSDTRLKTTLTDKMFAQIQWVWDYDNTPADDLDRNDNKLVLGVGWSF